MRCRCCKNRTATKRLKLEEGVFDALYDLYDLQLCHDCFDYLLGIVKRAVGL